jgi:membrane fusion protein (multidrug efflux system)
MSDGNEKSSGAEEKSNSQSSDDNGTAPHTPSNPQKRFRRRPSRALRYFVIGGIAIVAGIFAGREVMSRMTHVYEYDARVTTDHITIGSRVDGLLVQLNVESGDRVDAGTLLAQVDDKVQTFELEALRASLAGVKAERTEYAARTDMVTRQTDSRVQTRTTEVQAQQARRSALVAELRLAQQELERFQSLFNRRVISRARLDRAEAEVSRLESELRRADADIASSRGEAAEAEADKGELTVIQSELAILDHKEAELLAKIARQEALIAQRAIRAPIPGIIDRVFVENGEFVGPGRRVLMLHNPENVWVEANIKETQVRRLNIGQSVHITVDAFPDDNFMGRVEKIGTAATSRFALLPTPNPSGNFTKVTQRIPVKIAFTERPKPLSPGMMVEVEIDVRDQK